jgi:hypothetical protein
MNELGEATFNPLIDSIDGPNVKYTITPYGYDGYYSTIVIDPSHNLYFDPTTDADPNYDINVAQYWMNMVNSYTG